jgi:hypothetical protein
MLYLSLLDFYKYSCFTSWMDRDVWMMHGSCIYIYMCVCVCVCVCVCAQQMHISTTSLYRLSATPYFIYKFHGKRKYTYLTNIEFVTCYSLA